MNNRFTVLVVEDDAASRRVIDFELKFKGYATHCFENAEEALLYFRQNPVDLVLVDYSLPGMNGEDFYRQILTLNPITPVVFMTALNSVEKAVQLLKMGAYSYLTKPLKIDELHHTIKEALDKITLFKENQRLQEKLHETYAFQNYVFHSEPMQRILQLVARVAKSNSNVLITGESGTGKDVLSHIIHDCSGRKDQPMVKVNLSALPASLIEAELFGAQKGAYTGAIKDRSGKFEEADKGTLFLDEIGELTADIQVKLLRAIQFREITRLGSNKPIQLDIRLITATNKNLQELVKEKKFREDLYYRLNVINIEMPPLRNRKEDIPLLIDLFIDKFNQSEGKHIQGISKDALNMLLKYPFPGNLRELENIIERALVLSERDILDIDDLPVFILNQDHFDNEALSGDSSLPLLERLTVLEKNIIKKTLRKHHYHQTNAARELGISEGCLRYKIKALNIFKEKEKDHSTN